MNRFFQICCECLHRSYTILKVAAAWGSLLCFLIAAGTAKEAQPKRTATLVLESADNNENTYTNGDFVSMLRGNVVFSYDDMKIRAGQATWWKNQGVIKFTNGVTVRRERQLLSCDRLDFSRDSNLLRANGRFSYFDSTDQTHLLGNEADYRLDTKFFQLRGDPKLIRYDTAAAETLVISGVTMSYVDSLKQATALEKVTITKGPLVSTCSRADFFTEKNSARLRVKPEVYYEQHRVYGDSIDLHFGKEALKSAVVVGNAHGVYVDTAGKGPDTALTHIWGDSLYLSVSDSGFLDSLWAHGKARSTYYLTSDPSSANEASGKTMVLAFLPGGNVDIAKIWGNARSTYFIDEKDGQGRNVATGDSISVMFRNGKARHLSLAGSARGVYYPRL